MKRFWRWLVNAVLRPKWVAFTTHDDDKIELGLKVWGVIFAMYKAEVYSPTNVNGCRVPQKREFGESLHPPEDRRQTC